MQNTKIKAVEIISSRSTNINNDFLYWIAGLVDGDGYFYMRKSVKKNKNTGKTYTYYYPNFNITTHVVERINIRKIKAILGFGSIYNVSGLNACRYTVANKIEIRILIKNLNGKLRLSKRLNQFELVCNSMNIKIIGADIDSFSSNAWLSGIFEADGCFYCNRKSFQISVNITQKDPTLLYAIQKEFNGNVYHSIDKKSGMRFSRYSCSKASDIIKWISYFDKYGFVGPKASQLIQFKELLFLKSRKDFKNRALRSNFLKKIGNFSKNKNYITIIKNAKLKNVSIETFLNLRGND